MGGGGGVRVNVNEELKFLCKFKKKNFFWGGGGGGFRGGFEVPISPRVNPLGKPGFTRVGF